MIKNQKTLYLHIGTPKTATTSIQKFFVENQEQFREEGYSYPLLDYIYPKVEHRRNGHFLVGRVYNQDKTENVEMEQELWDRGLAMIHGEFEKYPHVILSDENIWHASLGTKFEFWEKIKKDAEEYDYQIKVIVYLRRQDYLMNSWLSQQVKEGWNTNACIKWTSFKKKTRKIVLNYYNHLEKIAAVIGKENIIVRVFERGKFKGAQHTIYSDFLEAIGVEYKDKYKITEEESNKSLSGNSQEILRIVNSVLPDDPRVRTMLRESALTCERLKDVKDDYVMFTPEETENILKKYEECNKSIAEEYLGEEESLFSTEIKQGECWSPQNPYMYEDVVRFFADIVIKQQELIQDMESDLSRLKESRIESVKQYVQEFDISEGPENDDDSEKSNEEKFQLLSEVMINQHKDAEDMSKTVEKIDAADRKIHSLRTENLILKNELIDLKREYNETVKAMTKEFKEFRQKDKEIQKMVKDLREDVIYYRLKRKIRHLSGKDE